MVDAYNFEVNGGATKGRETKMPIDFESLQTVIRDSTQRVLQSSNRHNAQ